MTTPSPARLRSLVRRFRGRRLAVVGDLMLDRFIRGRVARISPEAPVPVVEVNQPETQHLGGAGNVAANLAALGARAVAFGVIGRDDSGRVLRKRMAREGVNAVGVLTDPARPTTEKTRIIADHQHVVRTDRESTVVLPPQLQRRLLATFKRVLPRLDGVVLSDYDKGVLTESLTADLLRECHGRVPVFVDLKVERPLHPGVKLVLINRHRAEEMAGRSLRDGKSLQGIGRDLMARFPCSILVITLGSQGVAVFEKTSRHIAALYRPPVELFDVTGAGDTVISVLSLAMTCGATAVEAATIANTAGWIVVGKLGTAVVKPADLLEALSQNRR